jgi:hypothetical protein
MGITWHTFMIAEPLIQWGRENPGRLFLTDGLGALVSSLLLGVVLVRLEGIFGIPPPTLYILALFPCLFGVFDLYSYRYAGKNTAQFLKGIATLNLAYCFLSVGVGLYHHEIVTYWGWAYILLEVMVVSALASLEYRVAQRLKFKSWAK